jgi:hypothetical protein
MSEYPPDHLLYDSKNAKVLGLMKDESCGKPFVAFASNRSKMYAMLNIDDIEKKKAKGVPEYIVKKYLCYEDYEQVVLAGAHSVTKLSADIVTLRSHKHKTYTEKMNKIALSSDDKKRYILSDGIHTRPHGH